MRAGADDWGGVSPLTADHVNPERPWPHLSDLAERTAELGFELRERLTAHPEFVTDAETWIDPALRPAVSALADPATGLAAPNGHFVSRRSRGDRSTATPRSASEERSAETKRRGPGGRPQAEAGAVKTPGETRASNAPRSPNPRSIPAVSRNARRLAEAAASDPLALDDREWVALLEATGDDLDALTATADDVRRYTVGEAVSLVVNRNLTSSGFRSAPSDDPATFTLDDVAAIAADAWDLGATELCVQGASRHPKAPDAYLDIARAVKAATPRMHLHAYRPQDVWDLAERGGLGLEGALEALREAGVDTVPGTGVKVLSERVRALIAPGDLEIDRWVEGITAAHRAGFRSTSVLFYGHVETAAERIAHLRRLRAIQDATSGFTEFVPIPLPGKAGGVSLVPAGPRSTSTGRWSPFRGCC